MAYRSLLEQLDRWFAESASRHPGVVPCRAGCSACCQGPFDISAADVLLVREAFEALPAPLGEPARQRAAEQMEEIRNLEPGWRDDLPLGGLGEERFDRVTERLADRPCPLLDAAGQCLVYDSRPLVCRMIGLGMVTPAGRVIENACPIAGEFPAYATLPPEAFDLEELEDLESALLDAASVELFGTPGRGDFETTIAGAITGAFPP